MFNKCFVVALLFGALLLDGSDAAVYQPGAFSPLRLRRLQHRSVMYPQPEMMYIPAMSTFTSGDTFTGYLDPVPVEKPCPSCRIPEPEPEPLPQPELPPQPEPEPIPELEESTRVNTNEVYNPPVEESVASSATEIPALEESTTQKTRTRVATRPPPEEEEEDDYEDMFTGFRGRKGQPHNVYFPMMFGYPGYGRSGQGGYPGVTAIANAFSSGKGGVATSHATAFGNAPPTSKQWKRSHHN